MNWDVYNKMIQEAAALPFGETREAAFVKVGKWLDAESDINDIKIAGCRERIKILDQGIKYLLPLGTVVVLIAVAFAVFTDDLPFVLAAPLSLSMLISLLITYIRLKRSEKRQELTITAYKKEHGHE